VGVTSQAGLRASPSARRIARLRNVDLAAVTGSGPHGRIGEKDVEAYADTLQASQASPEIRDPGSAPAPRPPEEGELVPFNSVRKRVAQRLSESARTAPHFYLSAQIEMTALLASIRRLEPVILEASGAKLSMTVMLAHIAAQVLTRHPLINASVEGDGLRMHPDVHLGIAMDREGDLLVPVLRNANRGTLADLAKDFGRLREAVRARTITPSQLRGGTFTISNLGMYEVDAFTAIINQPESAILAIGRIVDTPVGRHGHVVLRPMATFSLSSDHRVVDGITAARFMADLRSAIEEPAALP
jgi:pyruvate dehydrogenase E2 component (dihydrolipoamide acetyltransferase)